MAVRRESRSEIWWRAWSCSCWRVAAEVMAVFVVDEGRPGFMLEFA